MVTLLELIIDVLPVDLVQPPYLTYITLQQTMVLVVAKVLILLELAQAMVHL
jgi:hypothetical protein